MTPLSNRRSPWPVGTRVRVLIGAMAHSGRVADDDGAFVLVRYDDPAWQSVVGDKLLRRELVMLDEE